MTYFFESVTKQVRYKRKSIFGYLRKGKQLYTGTETLQLFMIYNHSENDLYHNLLQVKCLRLDIRLFIIKGTSVFLSLYSRD